MATLLEHHSPFSGSWYPADPGELRDQLDRAFAESEARTGAFVRPAGTAFVVPHAAPIYSGTVAASTYRHARARGIQRVILLGFSHRRSIRGIAVPDLASIHSPLGAVPVDRRIADRLALQPPFHAERESTVCDHSVEIQLPFLQYAMPGLELVPLYVGTLDRKERALAASILRDLLDDAILIASSDLTHYGHDFGYVPFPHDAGTGERLRDLDTRVISAAGSLDPELFLSELAATGSTVCGYAPISLLLETMRGIPGEEGFQETLDYQTSGEITGDYAHSVSYGAMGYFPASAFRVDAADRARLIHSARETLDQYQRTRERRPVEPSPSPPLEQRSAAFVTLYSDGELRGCVGRCLDRAPLAELVPELALSAALDDCRFDPVNGAERLDIEVHVLSPMKRIGDPRQLIIGEHGGYLEYSGCRGLLLPIVATEHRMDRDQFLKALARKTGVPPGVYGSADARLSVFRDQVFNE